MRIATFRAGGRTRLGVVRDERIVDLMHVARVAGIDDSADELNDMLALIAGGERALERVVAWTPTPPSRRNCRWIWCSCWRRFHARARTSSASAQLRGARRRVVARGGQEVKLPPAPNIFTKAVTAINGPYADIPYDAERLRATRLGVELAVVDRRGGRHIPREEALSHVWGYTVVNDVSARDIQNRPGMQWFLGKSLDGSFPWGRGL